MTQDPSQSPLAARRILESVRTRAQRPSAPPLGRAVESVLKPLSRRFATPQSALAADWERIVGPELARVTTPASLRRGVLTVRTSGAAAAALQHRAPEILERVNAFAGAGSARRLAFLQTG